MAFGEKITFSGMLLQKKIRLPISEKLAEVPVRNFATSCQIEVEKYLLSANFRKDLDSFEDEVVIASGAGWLHIMELWFREKPDKSVYLSLEFAEDIDKLWSNERSRRMTATAFPFLFINFILQILLLLFL